MELGGAQNNAGASGLPCLGEAGCRSALRPLNPMASRGLRTPAPSPSTDRSRAMCRVTAIRSVGLPRGVGAWEVALALCLQAPGRLSSGLWS